MNTTPDPTTQHDPVDQPAPFECTPWCVDGDGHPDYIYRSDQSCWGPYRKTVFGLDEHAPKLPMVQPPSDATGIAVYAYQGWYQLPTVKLNVYHDPGGGDVTGRRIDHDFLLTPAEAVELAAHLVAAVEEIDGEHLIELQEQVERLLS